MKALVSREPGNLEIADIDAPIIGDYEALVKIEACGICNSTDAKLIDGTMFWAPPYPLVLGHESVGIVVSVGQRVKRYKIGDRVTRPIYRAPDAASGPNSANGGFAEFGLVTDADAMAADGDTSMVGDYNATRQVVVPSGLSAVEAALCISLSETASILDSLPNMAGKTVLCTGTGIAGLTFGLWSKLAGARIIVVGRRAERLALANKLGADRVVDTRAPDCIRGLQEDGGRIDVVFEATGAISVARAVEPLLHSNSLALAYGVPPTGESYGAIWQNPAVNEHLRYAWVADLITRGWIKSDWFITHTWTFDEAINAFEQSRSRDVFKGFISQP